MKNSKNRLFDELNESKMTEKSMAITKGGTRVSDACSTKPGQPMYHDK